MLLGVEKNRKQEQHQEEDLESGGRSVDEFKDVTMVSHNNVAISREDPFEFHKARPSSALMPPFSKPAPSKWDAAQKWIASPNLNRTGKGKRRTKFVTEVVVDVEAKRSDSSEIKREIGGQKGDDWVDSCVKPAMTAENPVAQSAINLSQHDSSTTVQSATTFITPASTVRSVSMRDMGTEMTPIASQEPSRTGTPVRATTPMLSPSSSGPSTPRRGASTSILIESANCHGYHKEELSEKELQMKTRKEIMMLGTQLGKMNIAAWASKEDEGKDASTSSQTVPVDQPGKSVIQSRAAAWEEAEKAKYLARFKEEEIKIQAWENHQKAKSEAEMRKIEVEVERMKAHAHDKLMNKLTFMRNKAEEKSAAAEAKRNQQASRTAHQVDCIRRTGRIPSSFFCCSCCS